MTKKKNKKTVRQSRSSQKPTPSSPSWMDQVSSSLWRDAPITPWTDGRKWFFGILGVFTLALFVLSFNVGINGDEDVQDVYSDAIVDYYLSFGQDKTLYNLKGVQEAKQRVIKHYGAIYELPAGLANRMLGLDRADRGYHYVRHLISSLFGLLALFFAGRCAYLLAGWRGAICAILVLGLSPRFLGHSLINPKDIPFAMGYMMSLYYMLRLLRSMPNYTWRDVILLGVGIGVAISSRAGGVLLIAYLGLFLGLSFLLSKGDFIQRLRTYATVFFSATGLGFVVGTLFWPYALDNPISAIPDTLETFTNFPVNIRILFAGDMVSSTEVGWTYIPKWWLISSPIVMLAGLVIMVAMLGAIWKRYAVMPVVVIGFAFLFPILYTMYQESAFYGGMRHMLFAYCAAATLAGMGWSVLWDRMKSSKFKLLPLGLMALLLLEPTIHLARNHQVPYVFFNSISGGAKGALGNYELDTQGISVKQGLDWLINNRLNDGDTSTVVVTSNYAYNVRSQMPESVRGRITSTFSHHRDRFKKDWDYAIYICHFTDGAYLRAGTFPGARAIHNVTVSGVPVATVLERGDKGVYDALKSIGAGDMQTAIPLLEAETKRYPKNDVAWASLGDAYLRINQLDKAIPALDEALKLNPSGTQILNSYGGALLSKGDVHGAREVFERSVAARKGNPMAYYRLAAIYQQQGDLNTAFENAELCVAYAPQFKAGYQLAADILKAMGDDRRAQAYIQAMNKR